MNTPLLRALTLHPEWAWASCYLGKGDENRPPRVAKMVLNVIGDGWLAIHAGKYVGGRAKWLAHREGIDALEDMAHRAGWVPRCLRPGEHGLRFALRPDLHGLRAPIVTAPLVTSAIVALTRVRPGNPDSPWAVPGQAQIGLRDLFVLPEPVPCSGKQGLWTVSDAVAVKVYAQLPKQEKP